jgi:hypothetical protein
MVSNIIPAIREWAELRAESGDCNDFCISFCKDKASKVAVNSITALLYSTYLINNNNKYLAGRTSTSPGWRGHTATTGLFINYRVVTPHKKAHKE